MTRVVALLLVACESTTAPPPVPPTPAVKPPAAQPPADAAVPAAANHLETRGFEVLCIDGNCLHIDENVAGSGWHRNAMKTPPDPHAIEWVGAAYTRDGDKLTADGKPMRAFPGGIRELSIGFRASCVLAGDGTVWCWSDPAKPRQMKVPAHVADIAVIEPFSLCVRTDAGKVSCTAPYVEADNFACDARSFQCGLGTIEQPNIDHAFDPVDALARPLVEVKLPEAATDLVRDNVRLYAIDMDVIKLQPGEPFGACVRGAKTITCWKPCGQAWHVFPVEGVPEGATLSPDQDMGYALAGNGELWKWTGSCELKEVTATLMAVPHVLELAPALHVVTGPQDYKTLRCAITVDHAVTCWTREDPPFDPR